MSTQDLITGYGNFSTYPEYLDRPILQKRYIDTTVTPLTSGDRYMVFSYPANTLILRAGVITETVEGAADTVDLEDDTSATTTLVNDHDLNTDNASSEYAGAVFKATAGQISLLANAAITAAKFWVYFESMQFQTTD